MVGTTPATEPPEVAGSPASTPAAPLPTSGAPPAVAPKAKTQSVARVKPLEGQVDAHMTSLLKKFVSEKGRMPQSILELAGATADGFPQAPAGYLYAIDPTTTQVKLVKQ